MAMSDREMRAAEEARRKAEAEDEAEERAARMEAEAEERQAALEAAAEARRQSAAEGFERRPVREDERGAPVLNRERAALESIASEPERDDVPAFTMTIPEDEIRTTVNIPEDEIRFTPNPPPAAPMAVQPQPEADPYERVLAASARFQQQPAPGGRTVDFAALDAQDDAANMASAQQAQAGLAQPPPTTAPAPAPVASPAGPGAALAPSSSPSLGQPPATPLPQQQARADAEQRAQEPAGSRIPLDVRTAAMPSLRDDSEPALRASTMPAPGAAAPAAAAAGPGANETQAQEALRAERAMKIFGMLTKLGLGLGGAALQARGGSPVAAMLMARGGGAVGNALMGASPTQQQARISQARGQDEARVRADEDLDLRRVAQSAQERRQAMLDAQQEERLGLEGRRVSAMEEGLGLRAEQTAAQAEAARALAAQRQSQGEISRMEADEARMSRDPESPVSRQAQSELRALMSRVPEDERISDEEIGALSASAADTLYNQVARRYGLRTRETRRGGGGGGGGGAADALGPTRSFREFAAREYPQLDGMDEAAREAMVSQAWSQLSSAERRAYIGGSAMSDTREDDERVARANNIPGWRWRDSAAPPDSVTLRAGQDAAEGAAAARENLTQMLDISARVTTSDRLAGVIGESQLVADYQAARNAFIGSLPALRNTGVINEGEYQRFAREFPDVVSIRTVGNIRNNVTSAQTTIGRGYRIKMQSLGFEPDEGSGGSRPAAVTRFRDPDGNEYRLSDPRAIARARAAGWEAQP